MLDVDAVTHIYNDEIYSPVTTPSKSYHFSRHPEALKRIELPAGAVNK
jgi:hypothetical protein